MKVTKIFNRDVSFFETAEHTASRVQTMPEEENQM